MATIGTSTPTLKRALGSLPDELLLNILRQAVPGSFGNDATTGILDTTYYETIIEEQFQKNIVYHRYRLRYAVSRHFYNLATEAFSDILAIHTHNLTLTYDCTRSFTPIPWVTCVPSVSLLSARPDLGLHVHVRKLKIRIFATHGVDAAVYDCEKLLKTYSGLREVDVVLTTDASLDEIDDLKDEMFQTFEAWTKEPGGGEGGKPWIRKLSKLEIHCDEYKIIWKDGKARYEYRSRDCDCCEGEHEEEEEEEGYEGQSDVEEYDEGEEREDWTDDVIESTDIESPW